MANNEKYIYEGTKNNNIDTGYKTTVSGIEKYYIDETGTYKYTGIEKILIGNLYENINSTYINVPGILNILTQENLVKETEVSYTYSDEQNEYFYFTDKGIVIFYPPYELSYYSRGFVDFTIDYEDLYGYIKPEYSRKY